MQFFHTCLIISLVMTCIMGKRLRTREDAAIKPNRKRLQSLPKLSSGLRLPIKYPQAQDFYMESVNSFNKKRPKGRRRYLTRNIKSLENNHRLQKREYMEPNYNGMTEEEKKKQGIGKYFLSMGYQDNIPSPQTEYKRTAETIAEQDRREEQEFLAKYPLARPLNAYDLYNSWNPEEYDKQHSINQITLPPASYNYGEAYQPQNQGQYIGSGSYNSGVQTQYNSGQVNSYQAANTNQNQLQINSYQAANANQNQLQPNINQAVNANQYQLQSNNYQAANANQNLVQSNTYQAANTNQNQLQPNTYPNHNANGNQGILGSNSPGQSKVLQSGVSQTQFSNNNQFGGHIGINENQGWYQGNQAANHPNGVRQNPKASMEHNNIGLNGGFGQRPMAIKPGVSSNDPPKSIQSKLNWFMKGGSLRKTSRPLSFATILIAFALFGLNNM